MIGEVEALIDQGVNVDRPVLSRALSGMQQHVLDDCVGALAVLYDLVKIAPQRVRQLGNLTTYLIIERRALEGLL